MSQFIDIFKIFANFPDQSPKNLEEVADLEQKCREAGKESLAEYLFLWRTHMMYQMEAEWSIGDTAAY